MDAEIIAIGSELILGTTVDTNSTYLAQQLARSGVTLRRTTVVGDDLDQMVGIITEACQRTDLVICTGGIGPTVDDRTREAVARSLNRPLVFRQDLCDQIAARFAAMNRPMRDANRVQAYIPQGARAIETHVYRTSVSDRTGTAYDCRTPWRTA